MSENESTAYQNLWDVDTTLLRGKIRAINADIKKKNLKSIT